MIFGYDELFSELAKYLDCFSENGFTFSYLGTKINRGTERIVSAPAPEIFRDIRREEYEKDLPRRKF